MSSPRFSSLIAALLIAMAAAGAAAVDAGSETPNAATVDESALSPRMVVEKLHGVLLECMKGGCGSDFAGRYERVAATLDETFDIPFMARVSIGNAWNSLSDEQRTAFVALSRRLSASNYASNFDSYGDQQFVTLLDEKAGRGTILVKTRFVQPDDDDVTFDYRLRKLDSGWRIIDVTLDGAVSEVTLRRADYGAVIKRQGYEKLVEAVEKKIAKLETE